MQGQRCDMIDAHAARRIPSSKAGPCLEDVGQGKLPISFINRCRGSWFHTRLLSIRDIFWVTLNIINRTAACHRVYRRRRKKRKGPCGTTKRR
jgi:hypothetical protein